jgi:hypothetical protein
MYDDVLHRLPVKLCRFSWFPDFFDYRGRNMPSESDGTKQPEDREKFAQSEEQRHSKADAKDGSKLPSESLTGLKPIMIYPIPRAGAHGEANHTPQGMTYEEVVAKNSPLTSDQTAHAPESTAATSAGSADGGDNNKSKEKRADRVPRTLIDFVVPHSDTLDSSPNPPAASSASQESASNLPQEAPPAALNVDNESSAAALSRIAGSQAINHKKDSPALRPPEVPPPMRRKRPKTMLDILVRVGNQLTGAGHAPEIAPEQSDQPESSEQAKQLPVQANSDEATSQSTEYYSNEAHYPAPDYSESNEQHTFYQGADGQLAVPEETRGDRTPRTLLDHSVLADIGSRSAEKMVLKAAEELKERLHEPFVPFIPVMEDRIASPCPWKWEGNESKERVKYCDKCKHQVYNFAGIERPEADALIFKRENQAAKTLFKREDGKFMTSDCPTAVKQTRGMVLAVVLVMFFLMLMFAGMLLAPQPPKQTVVKQEENPLDHRPLSSPVDRSSQTSQTGANSSTSGASAQATSNINAAGTASPAAPSPPQAPTSQPIGSNGGYGPITAPAPAANDFQWKYTSDPEKNPAPVTSATVTPAPPRVDPAQAAELQRLKQQIIDSSSR